MTMEKDIGCPKLRQDQRWRRRLQWSFYAASFAAIASMCIGTAQAVSVQTVGAPGGLQQPATKLVRAPNGCLVNGLTIRDRNDPSYAINRSFGIYTDDPQLTGLGPPNCSGGSFVLSYDPNIGVDRAIDLTFTADNSLWFTTRQGVVRSSNRVNTIYPVSGIHGAITAGSDGNLWFSLSGDRIAKMNTSGQILQEYNIGHTPWSATVGAASSSMMTLGADGNIWMVAAKTSYSFVKVTPSGVATSYPIPPVPGTQTTQAPVAITSGPDGAIWYVATSSLRDPAISTVGKVDVSTGAVTSWTVNGEAGAITAGPDGNVWFTTVEREYRTEVGQPNPQSIATGRMNRIATDGTITSYEIFVFNAGVVNAVGTANAFFGVVAMPGIGTGADGKLYATRTDISYPSTNAVGYTVYQSYAYALTPDAPTVATDPSITVVTSGTGRGTVQMRIGRNPTNSQSLVTLTATPAANSTFNGWSEASCTGTNRTCQITLSGDRTVTANFLVPASVTRTSHQGAIFTTDTKSSVLRLMGSVSGGIVLVKLIHPETGEVVGEQEVTVPHDGMISVYPFLLEPSLLRSSTERPGSYTITLEANHSFSGHFQHILWDRAAGALTNLTACETPMSNVGTVGFVHSSALADNRYPSSIVVTNPTTQDVASFSLGITDANTGSRLGTYTSHTVLKARGAKIVSVAELERDGVIPRFEPPILHYVVKAEGPFTGTLQHLMTNQNAGGVIADLTTACPLSGVTN